MSYPVAYADQGRYLNGLEPAGLIDHFVRHPPHGFTAWKNGDGVAGFDAEFDVLTTAPEIKKKLACLPLSRMLFKWLTWRTRFVGTTVSEYACLPDGGYAPAQFVAPLLESNRTAQRLMIFKDVPNASPLLSPAENEWADRLLLACKAAGCIEVSGQALAYVPIDFESIDAYLARLTYSKRKDLRRKLRSRAKLDISVRHTGDPHFTNPDVQQRYYALYEQVYNQSELHFDKLTPAFFNAVLQDARMAGVVTEYCHAGQLVGFNLCYVHNNNLVDKYIGMDYPLARQLNLYFVSWLVNLEYALDHGLSYYIAGWTDPKIKSHLGARFTPTRHIIYVRNPLLRTILKQTTRFFENDRQWTP